MHRTTRRLTLTETGRAFYHRCPELLSALDEAEGDLASRRREASAGCASAPLSFGVQHLAPPSGDYMSAIRRCRSICRSADRTVDLVEEGVDLAIRISWRDATEPDRAAGWPRRGWWCAPRPRISNGAGRRSSRTNWRSTTSSPTPIPRSATNGRSTDRTGR